MLMQLAVTANGIMHATDCVQNQLRLIMLNHVVTFPGYDEDTIR